MILASISIQYITPSLSFLTPSLSAGPSRVSTNSGENSPTRLKSRNKSSNRRPNVMVKSGSFPDVSVENRSSLQGRTHRNKSSPSACMDLCNHRCRSASPRYSSADRGVFEPGTSSDKLSKKKHSFGGKNMLPTIPCKKSCCPYTRNAYTQSDSFFDTQLVCFTGRHVTIMAFMCAVAAFLFIFAAPAYYRDHHR